MKPIKVYFRLGHYLRKSMSKHMLQVDFTVGKCYPFETGLILNIRSGYGEILDVLFEVPYIQLAFTICGSTWTCQIFDDE